MFDQIAKELDIPYKRTGKLIVGFNEDDRKRLEQMKATGDKNGVPGLELIDKERIHEIAPLVGGEFAMWSPSTAILDPFQYTVGLAENAAKMAFPSSFPMRSQRLRRTKTGFTP